MVGADNNKTKRGQVLRWTPSLMAKGCIKILMYLQILR